MPAIIACPSCGGKLRVADELRGRPVRCPACDHTFDGPAPEPNPPAPDLPLRLALDEQPSGSSSAPANGTPGLVGAVELKLSLDDDPPPAAPPPAPAPPNRPPPPRLADEHDDLKECPACGKHVHRDSTRCYHCGERLGARRNGDSPDIRRRPVRRDAEPDRGPMVLTMGIISLSCLFVWCVPVGTILGLISWIMGSADLRKMQRGEMDTEGEGLTRAGWICGILGTLLNGLVLLGCMGFFGAIWWSENNQPVNTRPVVVPMPPPQPINPAPPKGNRMRPRPGVPPGPPG